MANPGVKAAVYRFQPIAARYVCLTVTRLARREGTNFAFALAEMQVLSGKKNLAKNRTVTALDSIEAGGWSKARLVDGRLLPDPGEGDASYRPATMVRKEFECAGRSAGPSRR